MTLPPSKPQVQGHTADAKLLALKNMSSAERRCKAPVSNCHCIFARPHLAEDDGEPPRS